MSALEAKHRGAANPKGRGHAKIEKRYPDADIEFMINAKVNQAIYLLVDRWKVSQSDGEVEVLATRAAAQHNASKRRRSNCRSGS